MNDIKRKADELIKQFENILPWGSMTETRYYQLCVKCAITCQEREVKVHEHYYKDLVSTLQRNGITTTHVSPELTEAQELLSELKSRL